MADEVEKDGEKLSTTVLPKNISSSAHAAKSTKKDLDIRGKGE